MHVKLPSGSLKDLDDISLLMIFLGYEREIKDFLGFDPSTSLVYITRDVIFEEKCWNWDNSTLKTNKFKSLILYLQP